MWKESFELTSCDFLPPSTSIRIIGPPGFEFPCVSGDPFHRGTSSEITQVPQHPSTPTQRGNRKGHGRMFGDQWAEAGLRVPIPPRKRTSIRIDMTPSGKKRGF